jgi:hypothetical protein
VKSKYLGGLLSAMDENTGQNLNWLRPYPYWFPQAVTVVTVAGPKRREKGRAKEVEVQN